MLMVPRVVLLVALISVLASAEKRVLRRGDKNLGNRNTGECLEHPDLQLSQVGQRTADSIEDFMSPSPNLHIHRTKFGYTDESVLAFYHSASLHFLNLYGVDFSRVPTDPETGARTLGNFMLKPQVVDFGLRIPYTSVHGRFDCAREVFDEGLVFMVTGDDIYHGSFGGSAGKPAKAGDFAPFGHYAIDFDNDGDFTMMRYQAAGPPVRPTPIGIFHIDCDIFSMRWGWGKSEGTFDWKATNDAGKPHVASRSVLSFPSRYQMAARAGFP